MTTTTETTTTPVDIATRIHCACCTATTGRMIPLTAMPTSMPGAYVCADTAACLKRALP